MSCSIPDTRTRLLLLRGVLRRFFLNLFRPAYVRDSLARRQGACNRCGACCHLVANRCARLRVYSDGHSECWRYEGFRMPNCKTFPIDARDLAERDWIAPDTPCGYSWPDAPVTPQPSRRS
jgi:hypothetical protein